MGMRNAEGYFDLTAYEALRNVDRGERKRRKKKKSKKSSKKV